MDNVTKPAPKLIESLVTSLAIAFSTFHILTAIFGQLPGLEQRIVHLTVVLLLIFLLGVKKDAEDHGKLSFAGWANVLLSILTAAVGAYTFMIEPMMSDVSRVGLMSPLQIVMGVTLIALCLEGARQTVGAAFAILALIGIAYILWGGSLPVPFDHPPVSFSRAVEFLYFSPEGIFGLALGVSASYLILFVIFGAFMAQSGLNDFTVDMSRAFLAKSTGGEAKVAVVGSGVMASVTGSDMANAASTGAVTIPLMIKAGYPRAFAAAIESVSSNGAQLMPPVLGTAAFLIAEIVRVPYGEVARAAVIPGLMFYVLVYTIIHFRAMRLGMRTENASGEGGAWRILLERGHLLIPLVVLVYLLAVAEASVALSALYAILAVVVVSALRSSTRMSWQAILIALREGAFSALGIGVACAVVGIMMGMFGVTGLGLKLSGALIDMAGGNVTVLLILTAIASIVLGTGLPTLPCYIILAILVAPALTKLGVDPLAAHLFILYYGNLSSVTPPVALSVTITSSIAKANFWEASWMTMRLSLATMLLPFAFAFDPSLLLRGEFTVPGLILAVALKSAGLMAAGIAMEGFWRRPVGWPLRVLAFVGGLVMVLGSHTIALAGIALLLPLLWQQLRADRSLETQARPS